jgi:hypothetical protein
MSDSHIPGRPGPGIYANGGVHSPRYRLPLVGEAATDHPVPPRLADQPAPIRTNQASGPIRTFTINEATQRGNQ